MKYIKIILIPIIFLLLASSSHGQKTENRPPNIIFILSDDLSWGDLGCYDGISILPTLLGEGKQKQHDYLYWEFIQNQAVRKGKWFAHRANGGQIELYDLISDPQQSEDLSNSNSKLVKKIEKIMEKEHSPSDVWPSPGETPEEFNNRLKQNNIPERPDNISFY